MNAELLKKSQHLFRYYICIKVLFFAVECEHGTYGNNCVHNCSGNCLNDSPCNRQNGHCEHGCKPGYSKPLCDKRMQYWFDIV